MILSSLLTDFLECLEVERNASLLTIRNYDQYLKKFLDFAGDIEPESVDLKLVKSYKLYLSKKPLKRKTRNCYLIALRTFLRYLEEQNIKSLSKEEVKLDKQEASPLKVLNDTQLMVLLDAPDTTKINGIRDKAILETIFSTGLRVSELVLLNRNGVNSGRWLEKYLYMRRCVRKDSFKPLFIRFQGRVVVENDGEAMRLTPRSIQRIVEKYVKKLGLSVKATPHTLRSFTSSRISPDL
ncbi:MAG: putative Tyrosine recombinase xerD [Microgenomates group bacterium Gr01-1014_7]|nr:MAG: putative Tyrosine recombinase xerD [Microgenomates group bacterium Gr01-1014_7]